MAVVLLGACGSARTELPASVAPGPTLPAAVIDLPTVITLPAEETTVLATTTLAFKSPGERHLLSGGTLAVSYPRVGVRPPRGVAPPPPGQVWAVVSVRFCADATTPVAAALVDPARFQVEVPGQGYLGAAVDAPALAKAPLAAATADVAPRACVEGTIPYLIGGEGHIEAITYDSGAGLLRWAT